MNDFEPGDCEVIDSIMFDVWGDPAPQGSKKAFIHKKGKLKGKIGMAEMSKKVKPWRKRVAAMAQHHVEEYDWVRHVEGPIKVSIQFFMKYPKTPKWKRLGRPDKMPDIDKLARSTLDGLSDSKVIFEDDRQVVDLHAIKHYVPEGSECGARIWVTSLRETAKPKRNRK